MANRKECGERGEKEVVKLVLCPNCRRKLQSLPENYPLYDVQCKGCSFRAQVKTLGSKPADTILGAGWNVMEKVLKSGFMVPPLIVNFKWTEGRVRKRKVLFYPFIPRTTLTKFKLSRHHKQRNYKMFKYRDLKELPHFTLYEH